MLLFLEWLRDCFSHFATPEHEKLYLYNLGIFQSSFGPGFGMKTVSLVDDLQLGTEQRSASLLVLLNLVAFNTGLVGYIGTWRHCVVVLLIISGQQITGILQGCWRIPVQHTFLWRVGCQMVQFCPPCCLTFTWVCRGRLSRVCGRVSSICSYTQLYISWYHLIPGRVSGPGAIPISS